MEKDFDRSFFEGYREAERELARVNSTGELDSLSDRYFKQAVAERALGNEPQASHLEGRAIAAMMIEIAKSNGIAYTFDEENVLLTRQECAPMQRSLEQEFRSLSSEMPPELHNKFLRSVADGHLNLLLELAALRQGKAVPGGSSLPHTDERAPSAGKSPIFAALRWIALLPGAFALAWFAQTLVRIIVPLSWRLAGQNPDSPSGHFTILAGANALAGAAFVLAASRIAPSHRRGVAATSTALMVLIGAFFGREGGWMIVSGVALAIGALIRYILERSPNTAKLDP